MIIAGRAGPRSGATGGYQRTRRLLCFPTFYGWKKSSVLPRSDESATWQLRNHEVQIATFEKRSMYAAHPVPVAAASMCFTLIRYGVPGGEDLGVPRFHL